MNKLTLFLLIILAYSYACTFRNEKDKSFYAALYQKRTALDTIKEPQNRLDSFKNLLAQIELHVSHTDTTLCYIQKTIANNYYDSARSNAQNRVYYDSAIVYGTKSLDILLTQTVATDTALVLSTAYILTSSLAEKQNWYEALAICKKIDHFAIKTSTKSNRLAGYYNSKGYILATIGDNQTAIDLHKTALSLTKNIADSVYYLLDLANTSKDAGRYTEAFDAYNQGLALTPKWLIKDTVTGNSAFIGHFKHGIGMNYHKVHNYARAIENLQSAINFYTNDDISLAESQIELAKVYLDTKQTNQARYFAEKALTIRKTGVPEGHPDKIEALSVLGNIALAEKKEGLALTYFEEACQQVASLRVAEVLTPFTQRAYVLHNKAIHEPLPPQYDKAFQAFDKADSVLTETRELFLSESSKKDFAAQTVSFYEKAVFIAQKCYEQTKKQVYLNAAARFISRSKATQMLEGNQDNRAKGFGNIQDNILEKERSLKLLISSLERKKVDTKAVDSELAQAKTDLNHFKTQLEKEYPSYFKLKYAITHPLSISDYRKSLDSSMGVIEFFMGDSTLFTLAFDKQHDTLLSQPLSSDLKNNILTLQRLSENDQKDSSAFFLALAYKVYESLLEKPLACLKASTRLRIIPDGYLSNIPFDFLIDKPSPTSNWSDFNDISFLLKKYSISELYSLRQLTDKSPPSVSIGNFMGFGIQYDTAATIASLTSFRSGKNAYLPHAAKEVQEANKILSNGQTFLNQAATLQAFIQKAPQCKGTLYLAMHGWLNPENPDSSALVFTKTKTADSADYLLYTADLYSLNLPAQMAVLSACNTGVGTYQRGEGLRSLGYGFMYAGCASIVQSKWSIADEATYTIMKQYFENLYKPKDIALQEAKLKYLSNPETRNFSPNYWSAMTISGDISPLFNAKTSFLGLIMGSILIITLIGIIYFRKKIFFFIKM